MLGIPNIRIIIWRGNGKLYYAQNDLISYYKYEEWNKNIFIENEIPWICWFAKKKNSFHSEVIYTCQTVINIHIAYENVTLWKYDKFLVTHKAG